MRDYVSEEGIYDYTLNSGRISMFVLSIKLYRSLLKSFSGKTNLLTLWKTVRNFDDGSNRTTEHFPLYQKPSELISEHAPFFSY